MLQQILKPENFEISGIDLQASMINDYDSHTFSSENSETPVSDTDKEDSELKNQFMKTCINNEEYQEVKAVLKADYSHCIRRFSLAETELINRQVYY